MEKIYWNKDGMTMIEILVALAIASIMMLGIYEVFVAQKNLYVSTDITAQAQDNARFAIDSIQRDLSHAGFGIDPGLAFLRIDLTTYGPADYDRTDGPDTLQFLARERYPLPGANEVGCPAVSTDVSKRFYWQITSASNAGGITIHVCPGFQLYRGTILLAMCSDASTYVYFRYIGSNLSQAGETDVTISMASLLPAGSVTDLTYPMRGGTSNLDEACYSNGNAQLHRINFYRYYIRPADVDPTSRVQITPPYLMLDPGIDLDGDGNINNDEDDHIPVAEGIEDMQVVYFLLNGKCAGNPGCEYPDVEDIDNYSSYINPVYIDDPYPEVPGSSSREQDWLGNTVSVRVSIVARTSIREPIQGSSAGGGPGGFVPLDLENHIIPAPKPVDGYKRILMQITVPIINTLGQRPFPFM